MMMMGAHIKYLMQFFKDERYIKIDNKPVMLLYRTELHPNIHLLANIWRAEAKKEGFADLYMIRVENQQKDVNPKDIGFDAAVEFAPNFRTRQKKAAKRNYPKYLLLKFLHKTGLKKSKYFTNMVFWYKDMVKTLLSEKDKPYKYFRTIFPSWDNSARRKNDAIIFLGSSPKIFQRLVTIMAKHTREKFEEKEQLMFINAWNEWGEGCHLEPDEKFGTQYLEALKAGLEDEDKP